VPEGGYASFAAFVAARQTSLLRGATLMTGDVHLAQDLLQEALVKLALRWPHREFTNPEAYVRTIIYRDLLSWRRRLRREELRVDVEAPLADTAPRMDDYLALLDALRRLPPRQRAVIVLRYFEDLTEPQVADLLGISLGTVKRHGHDALKRLREAMPDLQIVAGGESHHE
jgi:RNA polymerase sigma-70 factor (sigma-E family)